jgi:polyphosphate kinase 2
MPSRPRSPEQPARPRRGPSQRALHSEPLDAEAATEDPNAEAGPASSKPGQIRGKEYERLLHDLQVELVKLQRDFIRDGERTLVILEGRDAAGKDGTIKRIVQHLSPREPRVVALGKPSDREQSEWYFQRYVSHLPAGGEMVLFNRSWYNRAGVERVMGFCTDEQYEEFMQSVIDFEHMLVRSGVRLFKYYLDISKDEQKERLEDRRKDPLAQWKISPLDAKAQDSWDAYSAARNEMLLRTRDPLVPWIVVRTDHKKTARVQLIQDLLSRIEYDKKDSRLLRPNRSIVFEFDPVHLEKGMLAS